MDANWARSLFNLCVFVIFILFIFIVFNLSN